MAALVRHWCIDMLIVRRRHPAVPASPCAAQEAPGKFRHLGLTQWFCVTFAPMCWYSGIPAHVMVHLLCQRCQAYAVVAGDWDTRRSREPVRELGRLTDWLLFPGLSGQGTTGFQGHQRSGSRWPDSDGRSLQGTGHERASGHLCRLLCEDKILLSRRICSLKPSHVSYRRSLSASCL